MRKRDKKVIASMFAVIAELVICSLHKNDADKEKEMKATRIDLEKLRGKIDEWVDEE